jgi:hypothetical protein
MSRQSTKYILKLVAEYSNLFSNLDLLNNNQ